MTYACKFASLLTSAVICPALAASYMTNAHADTSEIFKCKGKDGKVTVQDSPCAEDLQEKARQRAEASVQFSSKIEEQKKALDAAPNRQIHKELLTRPAPLPNQREALKELAATLINLNGLLCAQVQAIRPIGGDKYEVTCIEYRGRTGERVYHMDTVKGRAWLP